MNKFFLFIYLCILSVSFSMDANAENNYKETFNIFPWQVGQFVEYQIISVESEGEDNRYKISIVGKEEIAGRIYFWLEIDIYELVMYRYRKPEFKKNITFLMLVPPITSEEFSKDPSEYIANGFYPHNARKLKVQVYDGPFIEVDPILYFSHQNIIEETFYSFTPDAMGRVDFSRLQTSTGKEQVVVPAGSFECYHIFVNTNIHQEYWDEGFDLWRSPKVPLLGIAKMEFSKNLYWGKWSYRNEQKKINTIKDLLLCLYTKRVSGRRRSDTYTINLVNYGENNQTKN